MQRRRLHIEQFEVASFRALGGVRLTDLAPMNLIVGGNNSGKTSVLEALGIFAAPMDLVEWSWVARMREARALAHIGDALSAIDAIRWLFPQVAHSHSDAEILPIKMEAGGHWPLQRLEAQCYSIQGLPPEPRRYTSRRSSSDEIAIEDGWHLVVDTLFKNGRGGQPALFEDQPEHLRLEVDLWPTSGFAQRPRNRAERLKTVTLGPYSHRNQPLQVRAFSRSIREGGRRPVVELLRGIEPKLADLEIVAGPMDRPMLLVRHVDAGLVPVSVMGDGFRRALSIGLGLYEARGGLLLIDEIETAFHVSALDKVFPWLMEVAEDMDVQVFATTHSLEAIQAITASNAVSRHLPVAAYHLEQSAMGQKQVKRYSADMLIRLVRDRGLDIR